MSEKSLSDLAREITSGAVRLAAATAAWLRLVAEFDRREGWHAYGILSCAHWLAWQCGMSPGTAREHVRVARALTSLPALSAAFCAGRLSYSKVRALTRIAEPDTEASLLEFAIEATASQTERMVRQWRRADALDDATVASRRQFDFWWDDDGMLVLRLRLDPNEGAQLLAAVDSLAERAARRERADEKRRIGQSAASPAPDRAGSGTEGVATETLEDEDDEVGLARERTTARRCTAITRLATAAVDLDRRPGDPPRREVVVHVDATVIADDAAAGRAYLEGGPALHPSRVRRMLCEATVIGMIERGREVLGVGRARRLATRAQRRALLRRDGGCARPGCAESRLERLHAHHMRHWLYGGRTDLTNLVLLCDNDHGVVHDLDLVMSRQKGRLVVTAPDGRRVWGAADAAFASAGNPDEDSGPIRGDDVGDGTVALVPDPLAGVHPIDRLSGRRPSTAGAPDANHLVANAFSDTPPKPCPAATAQQPALVTLLFPDGAPPLPEAMHVNGERMDMAYVVGVLMGNRDLERRLRAEARGDLVSAA